MFPSPSASWRATTGRTIMAIMAENMRNMNTTVHRGYTTSELQKMGASYDGGFQTSEYQSLMLLVGHAYSARLPSGSQAKSEQIDATNASNTAERYSHMLQQHKGEKNIQCHKVSRASAPLALPEPARHDREAV